MSKKETYAEQVKKRAEAEKVSLQEKAPTKERGDALSDEDIQAYFGEDGIGDAKLFNRLHRNKIVGVIDSDDFLFWNGAHWEKTKKNQDFQGMEAVCELYLRLADKKREELEGIDKRDDPDLHKKLQKQMDKILSRVRSLRSASGQDDLRVLTGRVEDPLLVFPDDLDAKPYLLPCPNGVIDLKTGDLKKGNPLDYLLTPCFTEYDPELLKLDDPCPVTTEFLLRSMDGDKELVDFIWRLLGYGLIRDRKDHIFVIFWGEHGRNGKDTLIKLITTILGKALSGDVPVEMLLQTPNIKNSSGPSPDIMKLRGMCLAWINEAEENQRFALAKLKRLTGGGYITGRSPYSKEECSWRQTHLPIMTTNELPKAKADDIPFWQRAVIVKWPLSFVSDPAEPYERQADKYLDEKLEVETKGVLARMVRGAIEYLNDGLKTPDKVKDWTKQQRASWDDLAQFIEDWCELEPRQENPDAYRTKISATDLHDAFCIWYARYKDKRFSISAKKFSAMLDKKDIPSKRSNGIRRLGITLKSKAWSELEEARAFKPSTSFLDDDD